MNDQSELDSRSTSTVASHNDKVRSRSASASSTSSHSSTSASFVSPEISLFEQGNVTTEPDKSLPSAQTNQREPVNDQQGPADTGLTLANATNDNKNDEQVTTRPEMEPVTAQIQQPADKREELSLPSQTSASLPIAKNKSSTSSYSDDTVQDRKYAMVKTFRIKQSSKPNHELLKIDVKYTIASNRQQKL